MDYVDESGSTWIGMEARKTYQVEERDGVTIKRRLLLTRRLIVVLPLTFAPAVGADPLILQFGGVIDFVEQGLPINDQVAVGMFYTGTYQFDPAGILDSSELPTIGRYAFGTNGFMAVTLNSVPIVTTDLLIFIENSTLLDLYSAGNGSPFTAIGVTWLEMMLDLRDATHSAFDSTDLPLIPLNLEDFQFSKRFSMRQPERREPSITGTVEFLTIIPEPSGASLLLPAAGALAIGRRKR